MPSTHKRRLSDFIKAFARSAVSNLDHVETWKQCTRVALSATSSPEVVVFHAHGPCAVQRILFVPESAVAESGTDKWALTITNRGTDGSGSTVLLNAWSTETSGHALVAFDAEVLYNPGATSELIVARDSVFSFLATKSASAANLNGTVVVEFIPLLDE